MNLNHKTLVILTLIIIENYSLNALNLNDFCKLPTKNCLPKQDMVCMFDSCQKPFIYKCGHDKCARNETQCERFLDYEKFADSNVVKSLSKLSLLSEHSKKACAELVYEIESFKHRINICSFKAEALDPNDACIRGKSCYKISKTNNLLFGGIQNVKKVNCPCKGSHKFECNAKYCTVNEHVCKLLHKNQFKNKKAILKLKNCSQNFMVNLMNIFD
jgi:hypothetical protein